MALTFPAGGIVCVSSAFESAQRNRRRDQSYFSRGVGDLARDCRFPNSAYDADLPNGLLVHEHVEHYCEPSCTSLSAGLNTKTRAQLARDRNRRNKLPSATIRKPTCFS